MKDRSPLMYSIDILSKKWNPHILFQLYDGQNLSFSELKRNVEGISSKMLSDCLQHLEEEGLIEKVNVEKGKQRVEYSLTQKGKDFEMGLQSLYSWGKIYSDNPAKILLVDDNEWVVEMHNKWIGDTYDAIKTYNSREAISKCDSTVDIAVVDRRLPDNRGNDVAKKLREENDDLLVLMVTAIEPEEDVLPLAFDDYLVKPISEERLKDALAHLMYRKNLDANSRELMALVSKKELLEEYYGNNCESMEAYKKIKSEITEIQDKVNINNEEIQDLVQFAST